MEIVKALPNKKILVDVGNKVIERMPINKVIVGVAGVITQVVVKYNKIEYPIAVSQRNATGKPVQYVLVRTRG